MKNIIGETDMKDENLTIEDGIITKCNNEATSITIPASVKEITKKAFIGCKDLKEIIYDGTMDDWNQLSVDARVFIWRGYETFIPADVIKCTDGDVKIDKRDWMDYDHYMDARHWYEEDEYFEGDVLIIEDGVLTYCKKFVDSIEIPDGVTEIGDCAFADCENIESIVVPEGVTKIGFDAFVGCFALESVVLPDSVKLIEFEAFSVCSALKSVVLGAGLEKIEGDAFTECESLEEIRFNGTVEQWKAVEKEDEWIYDDVVDCIKCIDGDAPVFEDEDEE